MCVVCLTVPVKSGFPNSTKSGFLYEATTRVSDGTSSMKHLLCPSTTWK
jgi:hypothetical protein